jgi:CRP-like cAMP-binding protein
VRRYAAAGETIVAQGDAADGLYIIHEGNAEVVVRALPSWLCGGVCTIP